MPGINQAIRNDSKRLRAYNARRKVLLKAFKHMPRGSRSRCARDLGLAPVAVSDVLNEKRVSLVTLELIETWVMRQEGVTSPELATA